MNFRALQRERREGRDCGGCKRKRKKLEDMVERRSEEDGVNIERCCIE